MSNSNHESINRTHDDSPADFQRSESASASSMTVLNIIRSLQGELDRLLEDPQACSLKLAELNQQLQFWRSRL